MDHLQQEDACSLSGNKAVGENKRQEAAQSWCDLQHWAAEDALSWYQFPSLDCEKGEKKSLP